MPICLCNNDQPSRVEVIIYNRTQIVKSNPLKADPTRSLTLRRLFEREVSKRLNTIKRAVIDLVVREDAFGLRRKQFQLNQELNDARIQFGQTSGRSDRNPSGRLGRAKQIEVSGDEVRNADGGTGGVYNQRFAFQSTPEQVKSFQRWLEQQTNDVFLGGSTDPSEGYWRRFADEGYRKGAGRAFDDTKKPYAKGYAKHGDVSDFYKGTKEEFLRSSFGRPETVEKLQLLAGRTFTDLRGVSQTMATQMSRSLTEGLSQGKHPTAIARDLNKSVDRIGKVRSRMIARTEIIRAHAEGQLDSLERLGVEEVGVAVEWSTSGDDRVCPLCEDLNGVVMKIKEARGILPRHPNCRCAYIPANVGELKKGQVRSKRGVERRIDKSIQSEAPKRSLAEQKKKTTWPGADKTIAKVRPEGIIGPATAKAATKAVVPAKAAIPIPRVRRPHPRPKAAEIKTAVAETAEDFGVDPTALREVLDDIHAEKWKEAIAQKKALEGAHKITGIKKSHIHEMENQGKDSASAVLRGKANRLDTQAIEVRSQFPELGLSHSPDADLPGELWEILKRPRIVTPQKVDREILGEAAEIVLRAGSTKKAAVKVVKAVDDFVDDIAVAKAQVKAEKALKKVRAAQAIADQAAAEAALLQADAEALALRQEAKIITPKKITPKKITPASLEESRVDLVKGLEKDRYGKWSGVSEPGKLKVKAYRVGPTDKSQTGGTFFGGSPDDVLAYKKLHPEYEIIEYVVELKNPLVTGHQSDLAQRWFGESYGTLMDKLQRKYKDSVKAMSAFDRKILLEAKKRGYDGIVYTNPALPAKTEIVSIIGKGKYKRIPKKIVPKPTPKLAPTKDVLREKIGQGSTGPVYREGDNVVKSARLKSGQLSKEGEVYADLKDNSFIAKGKKVGDEIHTPFFDKIVSVDTLDAKQRQSLGSFVIKSKEDLHQAMTALSEAGYDYNDVLQFGVGEARKLKLLDFSASTKMAPQDALRENMGHLKTFYRQFGLQEEAKRITVVFDALEGMQTLVDEGLGMIDWVEPSLQPHAKKLLGQLAGRPKQAYYATNPRHIGIKGIAQTEPVDGLKVILSDERLTAKQLTDWEIVPVVH